MWNQSYFFSLTHGWSKSKTTNGKGQRFREGVTQKTHEPISNDKVIGLQKRIQKRRTALAASSVEYESCGQASPWSAALKCCFHRNTSITASYWHRQGPVCSIITTYLLKYIFLIIHVLFYWSSILSVVVLHGFPLLQHLWKVYSTMILRYFFCYFFSTSFNW